MGDRIAPGFIKENISSKIGRFFLHRAAYCNLDEKFCEMHCKFMPHGKISGEEEEG
jgi:hypothetical protein